MMEISDVPYSAPKGITGHYKGKLYTAIQSYPGGVSLCVEKGGAPPHEVYLLPLVFDGVPDRITDEDEFMMPECTLDKSRIVADGVDIATISGLPTYEHQAMVYVNGIYSVVTIPEGDTQLTLSATDAGVYTVTFRFPEEMIFTVEAV